MLRHVANRTVDLKGNTAVCVKTAGGEKVHFTVILSCMADGTKKLQAVVSKWNTMLKEKLPSELLVVVQYKSWVDEPILMQWLQEVGSKDEVNDSEFITSMGHVMS